MKLRSIIITLVPVWLLLAEVRSAAGDTPALASQRYELYSKRCRAPVDPNDQCKALTHLCDPVVSQANLDAARGAPARCTPSGTAPPGDATAKSIAWIPVIADFLVARARAELALYLKDHIADALCNRHIGSALFPAACAALQGTDDSLSGLPEALRSDLDALPGHLAGELPQHVPASAQAPTCALGAGAEIYPSLRSKGPVAALQKLEGYQPPSPCAAAVAPLPAMAKIIRPTIEAAITRQPHDEVLDQTAFRASLREVAIASQQDAAAVARLDEAVPQLALMIAELRDADPPKPLDRASATRAADALARALGVLVPGDDRASLRAVLLATADFATGRYGVGLAHFMVAAKDVLPKDDQSVLATLLRYGSLLGSLATAESDDAVRSILESAAAPLGSYRDFRRGVAGYVGALAGGSGGVELGVGNATAAGAPFLPLGIELGGPIGEHSSWNVLLSIVDLGAVAATRLGGSSHDDAGTGNTAKTTTQIDFASVFAPGLFAGIGLGNSPFVLGLGAEYLPASRQVFDCQETIACSNTRRDPVLRAMAFLAIDLPVLPLFR